MSVRRILLAACLAFALPSGAVAQDTASEAVSEEAAVEAGRAVAEERARLRFEDGRLAFAEGQNEIALAAFSEAYELSGRVELLYNIGLVYDRLRRDDDALAAFRGYLEGIPDAANRAAVESRIHVLEAEIAADEALARAAAASDGPGEEVWESPIFWTLLGIGVVGAGVGIGVGVALSQDPGTAPVMPGPSGVVIEALRF